MEHNLVQYREQLLREDCYAAAHNFRHFFSWLSQRTGDILIEDKSKQNAVISVVACVLDNRFDCTAVGNLGNRPPDKLPSVKFQLLLGKPTDTVFADDFDKVLDNLNQISNDAAPGEKKENLIVEERGVDVLRFTRPVFEQRRPPVRGTSTFSSVTSVTKISKIGVVDDITERWPVPEHLCSTMETVKHTHRAIPLRVYTKKKLISIEHVPEVLSGALIELHFELRHFEIAAKKLHLFNGTIEQIMVLQPGQSRPATIYKRHTAEEGPIRMNPTLAALQDEAPSGVYYNQFWIPSPSIIRPDLFYSHALYVFGVPDEETAAVEPNIADEN